MFTIKINFEQAGLASRQLEGAKGGQSLLELCLKNDIELHHNCGGVCACSTCHLYVNAGEEHLEELSDREEDFIDRAVNPRLNSRLGCQCLLVTENGLVEVTLPDQTQFLGE
jgi:2Fe-2S ferredoxin